MIEEGETTAPTEDSSAAAADLKERVWARDEATYADMGLKPKERVVLLGIGTAESAITVLSLLRVGVATRNELLILLENADIAADSNTDIDIVGEEGRRRDSPATTVPAAMLAREPTRWRNERAAFRALENLLDSQIRSFPTDRRGELSSGGIVVAPNSNQLNALRVISAERRVLRHWLGIARLAGKVLDDRRDSFDFGLVYADLLKTLLGTIEPMPIQD